MIKGLLSLTYHNHSLHYMTYDLFPTYNKPANCLTSKNLSKILYLSSVEAAKYLLLQLCWGDRGLSASKSLLEPGTKEGFGTDEDDMTGDASSIPILTCGTSWKEGYTN